MTIQEFVDSYTGVPCRFYIYPLEKSSVHKDSYSSGLNYSFFRKKAADSEDFLRILKRLNSKTIHKWMYSTNNNIRIWADISEEEIRVSPEGEKS